jgi:hypothetical protein
MSAKIRTIMLVSLVTVLIWLWAEGESLSSETLTPSVVFVQDGNDLRLEKMDSQWNGAVSVRLQGSTRALTDARRDLGKQLQLKLGALGVPARPGQQVVDFKTAIEDLAEIRVLGLSVVEVTPANTVVNLVQMKERELTVRPSLPEDINILGEATVSPVRVTVRYPEELDKLVPPDAVAIAPVTRGQLGTGRDDAAQIITTKVQVAELADKPGVVVSPDLVSVTFRLKRSVDTVTIASVPVWFSLPPTEGKNWNIEITDQFLRDVTFTGPIDAIAKIRSREVVPIAEVQLSSDDLDKGVEAKEAVFASLPPGVESGVAVKTVRVKIERRKNNDSEESPALNVPEPRDEGGAEKD